MAATALTTSDFGLFSDEMYSSTDLNRRSGEVLDHATKRPVTISRNKEQFALLRREHAAKLIKTATQFGPTLEFLTSALSAAEGKDVPSAMAWMKAFGVDDLRGMIREVLEASVKALEETNDWDHVHAIIHEWHESALVAMSGVLEETMSSPSDETPLTDPRAIFEAPKELVAAS